MSIHSYIERELIRKSIGTYFRRGKWVLHLLFLLLFWLIYSLKQAGPAKSWTTEKLLISFSLLLPFTLFFYTYCLYLVPFCFKQNKFRKFWLLLLLLLLAFPLFDFGLIHWAKNHLPELKTDIDDKHFLSSIGNTYFSFISSFAGFTSLLYFMELLEGVNTHKETYQNETQLAATELHLIKTQMNPDFMIRSLDGIIQLTEARSEHGPASVIDFSDVLRYRLYRSKEKLVALSEELTHLGNLMQLHNFLPGQEETCTLEIEGLSEGAAIVPLSLINIVEPILATYSANSDWSVLVYLLAEEKELQVAVELVSTHQDGLDLLFERIREDLYRLLYTGLNFTIEKEQHTYSLRTCIPIFRNLIA